jgi:glycosyltransferase involved in cell wall biosynthesis
MKNILHVMQCTNLGGMENVSYRFMRKLAEGTTGLRFRITTPRPFGDGKKFIDEFDPCARDFLYQGRFGWRSHTEFSRHVKELSRECSCIWVTGTCAASLAAIRRLKMPKVLSHHFHHFENRISWFKWKVFYELLCRDLVAVTFPTAFTCDEALRIAPWLKKKAHVVPNGFDVFFKGEEERLNLQQLARTHLELPSQAWIVMNGGWFIPRKRFDIFLKTAAKVKKRLPESYFVICGNGPLEGQLKRMSYDLGLTGSIRFTGWVEDLTPYYQASDVLLFNSDLDAFGCTPLEAAGHGAIVVASVIYGGLYEYIEHLTNGFLFNTHDVEGLTLSIIKASQDKVLCVNMREAGVRKLKTKYSFKNGIEFYKDIFN